MNQNITDIITKFETDLTAELKRHALQSVTGLLSGVVMGEPVKVNGRAKAVTNGAAPKRARKKGGKRTPEALVALTAALLKVIKMAPGSSIEGIGKSMGVPTKELALPVQKLWAAKAIRTKGQKRVTKYFAK